MKKFLIALALTAFASLARGQAVDFAYHITAAANHLDGQPSSSDVGPYSGTAVLGDFIYFNGTNWVSLNKPADGTYSVLFTAGVPSWTAGGGGGAPSTAQYWVGAADGGLSAEKDLSVFTGLVLNTAGTPTSKATNTCTNQFARSDTASGVWTCATVANADHANMNAQTIKGNANAVGGAAAAPSDLTAAQVNMIIQAVAASHFAREEFDTGCGAGNTTTGIYFNEQHTGAGSGPTNASGNGTNAGRCRYQSGTTTTGQSGSNVINAGSFIQLGGGAILYVNTVAFSALSDGTDTYKFRTGICNQGAFNASAADCTDGVFFEYDSTGSANWRTSVAKASAVTHTASSTAVTTAYQTVSILVNAAGTSADFYVGTTNIATMTGGNFPLTSTAMTFGWEIVKSAGTTNRYAEMDLVAWNMDVAR